MTINLQDLNKAFGKLYLENHLKTGDIQPFFQNFINQNGPIDPTNTLAIDAFQKCYIEAQTKTPNHQTNTIDCYKKTYERFSQKLPETLKEVKEPLIHEKQKESQVSISTTRIPQFTLRTNLSRDNEKYGFNLIENRGYNFLLNETIPPNMVNLNRLFAHLLQKGPTDQSDVILTLLITLALEWGAHELGHNPSDGYDHAKLLFINGNPYDDGITTLRETIGGIHNGLEGKHRATTDLIKGSGVIAGDTSYVFLTSLDTLVQLLYGIATKHKTGDVHTYRSNISDSYDQHGPLVKGIIAQQTILTAALNALDPVAVASLIRYIQVLIDPDEEFEDQLPLIEINPNFKFIPSLKSELSPLGPLYFLGIYSQVFNTQSIYAYLSYGQIITGAYNIGAGFEWENIPFGPLTAKLALHYWDQQPIKYILSPHSSNKESENMRRELEMNGHVSYEVGIGYKTKADLGFYLDYTHKDQGYQIGRVIGPENAIGASFSIPLE